MNVIGCQPKDSSRERADCATCGNEYNDDTCLNARLSEECELICSDPLCKWTNKLKEQKSKLVRCKVCKAFVNLDGFATHAASFHEDNVMNLISDETIVESLSEMV